MRDTKVFNSYAETVLLVIFFSIRHIVMTSKSNNGDTLSDLCLCLRNKSGMRLDYPTATTQSEE